MTDTPNTDDALLPAIDRDRLSSPRILRRLGAEVRFLNPSGLPLVDDSVNATHPRLRELRDLVAWCEGMVWSSPERVNLSAAT